MQQQQRYCYNTLYKDRTLACRNLTSRRSNYDDSDADSSH